MVVLGIILLVVALILGCVVLTRSPQYRSKSGYHSLTPVVALVAIAALVGGIYYLLPDDGRAVADGNQSSSSSTSNSTAPAKQSDSVEVSPELLKTITVKTASVSCPDIVTANGGQTATSSGKKIVTTVQLDIAAYKGVPPRPWTDSPSTPHPNTDPAQVMGLQQASFCWDPELGGMWANFFANMSVGNVRLVDRNPWLQPFMGDPALVNQTVWNNYVVLQTMKNRSSLQVQGAITENLEWQAIAEKLGTLMARYQLVGQQSQQSVKNLHLWADGASADPLPAIAENPLQERWPSLMLQLTNKGACAPTKLIGINLFDKRPEEFALPTCASSPTPPHQPTATTSPHHGGGSGTPTTTRPGCNNCTTTTTTPECGRKCHVTTTLPPPPTTTPGSGGTTPYHPPTGNGSGTGAPPTQQTTPTTVAQPATPPPTAAPPTTRVSD